MTVRVLGVCALLVGALVNGSLANAQNASGDAAESPMPARVVLAPPACAAALPGEAVLRMLRVELAGDGVERVDLATPGGDVEVALARVSIETPRCEADASEFLVTVDDATTRKSVRRAVDLADVPVASRPRALALAVAELLRASWLELAMPDTPPVAAPVPQPLRDAVRLRAAVASRPRAQREPARWVPFVGLMVDGRMFTSAATGVTGARVVGGVVPPWGGDNLRVRLRAEGGASFGSGESLLGDADVLVATGALAVTFGRGGAVGFECGPRVEVGAARVVGRVAPGRDATGITVGEEFGLVVTPGLLVGGRVRFGSSFTAFTEADLGWTFGGIDARAVDRVTGANVRVAGVFGPSFAIRIGLAWDL